MKRITLLIALLTGLGFFNRMSAGSDSGPVAVYVNVNNGGNVTLKVNNNGESTNSLCTWNVGLSQLNGYNFGNVSSLILDGGVAVGWAWDGNGFLADSWGVEYRVYKQGTSAPAWNSLPFDFQAADHSVNQDNSWNYNDQMWDANGKNINLLALATGGSGTYNVEIRYWRKDYWNSFYDSYLNNNFGTQTATFTITNHAPFIVTGTNVFNTAFSGLTIGLTETAYDFSAVYPSESSYLWEIIDIDGNPVSVANNTANTFSHTFADAGIYTVKLSVNGSSSENTTQTFRIIQKSDDGNKIFGGEMNYEQAWITKAIGNVLPNMTWSAAGTNPLGSTTSLSITDLPAQPGERFAIYQPVYLTAGTTYYYDMFMKTHSFDQMILQVYINDGSLLPIDVADHWDNSPENNEQFAFGVVNGYGDYKWKDDPQSLSDLFSFITYKGAGADKKCAFTAPSDGIYFVIIRGASWVSAGFDFSLSEIELAKGETLTWQGTSEDWNDTNNWSPQRIPNQYTTAIIPGGKAYYPTLDAVKFVRNIYFEQGGQIGRIDLLEAKRAYVQLNYGAQEMTNRWYMLSMPMQGIVSGDIAFGGKPSVFLRKFDAVNGTVSDGSNFIKGAWTNYYNSNKIGFEPGEGFIVWVNKGTAGDNLSKLGGVLELPCFEKVNAAGYNVANPYHYFDQEERPGKYFGHTDFEYFTVSGGVPQATGIFERGQERGRYSHRLNSEDITYAAAFSEGMALVGNPYMSSLDFSALYNEGDNANHILESYQIWTGEGFTAYTPNGSTGEIGGIALDQYIAPMQSFIVEKTGLSDNFNLEYKVANVSVARPNTSASLRNAGLQALNNKLEILASTPAHTILAFIAHRENGDVTLCPQDSRKLLLGISDTPEVYTLKNQASGGSIGVGANVINTSDITIPLALATTYQGNIQLTFNGMNTYNAQIKLIDYAENQEILLTGDSYTYSFNYTPAKVNSKVVANEERFAIQFSPNAPTGVDRPETAQASVYCKDHTIYALASPSDPIREIAIYNGQGQCLYVEKNIRAASRSFAVGDRSEVYLVKLITEKGVKNVKLINK